jgi:hypothetical protein
MLAAALIVVSLAAAALSQVSPAPAAAAVIAQTILPEDFRSDLVAAQQEADAAFDRMALEVVDILLNNGRDMLAC